ncbi:coiled-coil domain-containing protein 97-like isoform X2 [Dendronephthya gigantea]|nr:coiled-coil domain-containing protein 97-like isoform X2 [Dendronephthya gigantea]
MEEREMEECVEEEEEDDDDEDCERIDRPNKEGQVMDSMGQSGDKNGQEMTDVSQEDKIKLREEFVNIMRQRFLEGDDEEFDYATVDTNDEYDNLEILGQDEQDKYFDEEKPEMISNNVVCEEEKMLTDSEEEDYLSDKILEKCCASGRR